MGYAYYVLPDGREAGYGVDAECDRPECHEKIDRGLGYLCGRSPDGWRGDEDPGCGKYFCEPHKYDHDCDNPECGAYEFDVDGDAHGYCGLSADHDPPHHDAYDGHEFTYTEDDAVNDEGLIEAGKR